jgi:hypothetical protein
MNTIILVHILWCLGRDERGGAGRVRPSDVEDLVVGMEGITRYRVRKMFKDARESGLLNFHGNHYSMAVGSNVHLDLVDAITGLGIEANGGAK